jgi:hypothetical protein
MILLVIFAEVAGRQRLLYARMGFKRPTPHAQWQRKNAAVTRGGTSTEEWDSNVQRSAMALSIVGRMPLYGWKGTCLGGRPDPKWDFRQSKKRDSVLAH